MTLIQNKLRAHQTSTAVTTSNIAFAAATCQKFLWKF